MEPRKIQLLLTEVALNLLGNTFYNIDGLPVDNLSELYKIDGNESVNSEKLSLLEELGISGTDGEDNSTGASNSTSDVAQDTLIIDNDTNDAEASCSKTPTKTSNKVPGNSRLYQSPVITERIKYLSDATNMEVEQMIKCSNEQRSNYLDSRRHTQTSRSLLDDFYDAQRRHLESEFQNLLDFIRFIQSNETTDRDKLSRAMKDIFASKKYAHYSSTNRADQ